jgi:hypothetical protein
MLRDLARRLGRIERLMDRGGGGGGGPLTLIRVLGGLDAVEPMQATIGGMTIEIEPGEAADEFEQRAMQIGIETGATYVVVGGLPDRCIG